VGLPALAFDAHGCARLRFEPDVAVNLEVDPSRKWVHLYAVLGPVPPGRNEGLYLRLLQANFFGIDTRGATLSIDATRNEVLLCMRVAVDGDDASVFAAAMEDFAAAARVWTGFLAAADWPDERAAPLSALTSFGMLNHIRP